MDCGFCSVRDNCLGIGSRCIVVRDENVKKCLYYVYIYSERLELRGHTKQTSSLDSNKDSERESDNRDPV